ncbi:MAG: hypothetical protein KKH29_02535 [Candidatus Omnitrophica bacterium]|nr:hypothetical protein [Candidatus Omnitrophota bacterium]
MEKSLKILGNGQVWDLKGILPATPQKTFEDLFSGRALGRMARGNRKIFSRFKEKGKITGLSVTKALLSRKPQARRMALMLLEDLAKNAALGIEALTEGKGIKEKWLDKERRYWRNLDSVVIGGGVSEGATGRILVTLIKRHLSKNGHFHIQVHQARFPGKEAGFLGALINILEVICNEGKRKELEKIAAVALDLGREEIGVGLLAIETDSGRIILSKKKQPWLIQYSVKTPYQRQLKIFLDARRDYTKRERIKGGQIRGLILKRIANLIVQALNKTQELGLVCSGNIGVAIPGAPSADGFIIDSTNYLPFFRKQDGFNFARALAETFNKRGLSGYRAHLINDGIAAGIANTYFDFPKIRRGKFAFLGVGSGLGGCVGLKG